MKRMDSGIVCVEHDQTCDLWQIRSSLFALSLGADERGQLAVLSWRNERTGKDWIKTPVPFFGFGTNLDDVSLTSLLPRNDFDAFVLTDFQQHKKGELTELQFPLRHQRLSLVAKVWLRTFDGTSALEFGFSLRNEGSEIVTVKGLDALVLTVHTIEPVRILTLTGGRYDEKFPPSSFTLTEHSLQDGESFEISCGDEGRSSAKDIGWFGLGLTSSKGNIVEGIIAGLEWSGRWRGIFQRQGNAISVRMGATEVVHKLSPGSEICSPSAFLLLFDGDWDDAGWQLHQWQEKFLCPPAPPNFPWVQFNSWFGWTTRIDEATMMREVDIAADLGCEVFVIDAGWYEGCGTEDFGHGLGNWIEHRGKFPKGLKALSDYVHSKGMKFGLWFEPERVDLETDLAKQNPNWLAKRDGKVIGFGRYAHLCFGNPQVVEWFKERLAKIIADYSIDWLKWDYNIAYGLGCDDTSHGHQEGDGTYAHTFGVYAVKRFLLEKFPNLVIEGCASGGNRIDFGILRYVHTYWLSDFTHRAANVRFHLTGSWFALPPGYLNAWVVHEGTTVSDFRSRMGGAFGITPRLAQWDEATRERAKNCIAEYKRLRPFVMKRRFLLTPQAKSLHDWTVWQFHDPESDSGAILAFREQSPNENLKLLLKGLDPKKRYELQNADSGETFSLTGEQLMSDGFTIAVPQIGESSLIWVRAR
ncbi:MAG: alpha-galactosidase [Armatimonadetes bacterium]|nr:alpha-galactosidase [Armatimonadota bacterium]MDW8029347.1 alpha-galactosidase [Armatimonadota bacterium]